MPGLSGFETLRVLRRINPEVRCCFTTGDLGGYTAEELRDGGAIHLSCKPFQGTPLLDPLRKFTEYAHQ